MAVGLIVPILSADSFSQDSPVRTGDSTSARSVPRHRSADRSLERLCRHSIPHHRRCRCVLLGGSTSLPVLCSKQGNPHHRHAMELRASVNRSAALVCTLILRGAFGQHERSPHAGKLYGPVTDGQKAIIKGPASAHSARRAAGNGAQIPDVKVRAQGAFPVGVVPVTQADLPFVDGQDAGVCRGSGSIWLNLLSRTRMVRTFRRWRASGSSGCARQSLVKGEVM